MGLLKATVPSSTALLTTGTEAWSVRVATHACCCARVIRIVSPLNFSNYFSLEMFGNLQAATQTDDFAERYALYEAVMMEIMGNATVWFKFIL